MHQATLIPLLSVALVAALLAGLLVSRLRLPPIVGYLLAGVIIGPSTPGFVGDVALAQELAEVGVILLMFGVGLHFSPSDLLAVRRVAVPGALGRLILGTLLGIGLAALWGWGAAAGLMLGMALTVSSTVVLLRSFEDQGVLDTAVGRIAIGWLIVEDIAVVLALVVIPAVITPAGAPEQGSLLASLALTLGKLALLLVLATVVGSRIVPWLLERVARTGSRELFTLALLALALGVAYGSAVFFGVSVALGAFLAGIVVGESDLSHRAANDALPLRDAFAVLFFVSVGMLVDPAILLQEPLRVLAVVATILVAKGVVAAAFMLLARYPLQAALLVAAGLAQIGEFSFILATLAVELKVLPSEGRDLILAGAILSIALNPLVLRSVVPLTRWVRGQRALDARLEPPEAARADAPAPQPARAVIVGFGRVGRAVAGAFAASGVPFSVVEQDLRSVEALHQRGIHAVFGDAVAPGVLERAGVANATLVVVATPEPIAGREVIRLARELNPKVHIVARTHSDQEQAFLEANGADYALMGERELAASMVRHSLQRVGVAKDEAIQRAGAARRPPALRDG